MSILATLVALHAVTAQSDHQHGHDWRSALPPQLRHIADSPALQEQATPPPVIGPQVESKEEKDAARLRRDIESDIEQGKKIVAEIDKEVKPSKNEEMNARLQAIGQEVAQIANEQQVIALWGDRRFAQFPYQFKLIEGEDVNAFSLPGGTIYVYEGLMNFTESDDELAAVMAHEICHASFRHVATLEREQNKLNLINIPMLIVAAMSRDPKAIAGLTATQLATQGLMSGWSVEAESSSDYGGIQLLVRSRYNAVGMLTFMERLEYRDRFGPNIDWGIYRTHPPSKERARMILQALGEYKVKVRRSAVTKTFSARSVPVEGRYEVWFGNEKIHTFAGATGKERAAQAVLKVNAFTDAVPQMIQVSSSGGTINGRNRELFSIEASDLEPGETVAQAVKEAVTTLKRIVFDLGYRVSNGGA